MKFISVVLGVIAWTACSSDPGVTRAAGEGDDPGDVPGDVAGDGVGDAAGDGMGDGASAAPAGPFERLQQLGRGAPPSSAAVRHVLAVAADRLAALQADAIGDNARNGLIDADPDDGGWDFIVPSKTAEHTGAASPPNLYGETALGAWAAVQSREAGNRALVVALDAGIAMQRNPDIDSPPDFAFGVLLAQLADNPGFAEIARQRYDARRSVSGGAAGLGTAIRDGRHARHEDGLIAYDVGWLSVSAAALDTAFPGAGYAADADTYAAIIVDDLTSVTPDFDLADPSEGSYVLGLAWSLVAAQRVGASELSAQIRARLLDQQRGNGAWPSDAVESADNLQATAIAVETLALTDAGDGRARQAAQRAVRWLLSLQAASGGWPDAAANELPLVDAEIMVALLVTRPPVGTDAPVPGASGAAGRGAGDRRPEIDFWSASSARSAEQGPKTPWEEGTLLGVLRAAAPHP